MQFFLVPNIVKFHHQKNQKFGDLKKQYNFFATKDYIHMTKNEKKKNFNFLHDLNFGTNDHNVKL
jgi:hypothetical protein